ncbi:hypothetical protein C0Q70_14597 [Pomacea canaliculata]|uniref:Uncharacterized protein n=1 Tax=Pomacea canaliculata TaxID=400727 RepID=A0A2T7NSH3_POMCA|nr:hypothetical protein C0Q70_14597 [Pomacea canaliculata]
MNVTKAMWQDGVTLLTVIADDHRPTGAENSFWVQAPDSHQNQGSMRVHRCDETVEGKIVNPAVDILGSPPENIFALALTSLPFVDSLLISGLLALMASCATPPL